MVKLCNRVLPADSEATAMRNSAWSAINTCYLAHTCMYVQCMYMIGCVIPTRRLIVFNLCVFFLVFLQYALGVVLPALLSLNTRTGEGHNMPYQFFANVSKTVALRAAKFRLPAHGSKIHLVCKF